MAILMIHGPDDRRMPATGPMQDALNERAQAAGQALVQVRCDDARQLVERLARIEGDGADIILLDPGRCTRDTALHATLEHLAVPYIEVHADRHDRPEPQLPAGGPRVAVITGYEAQSYTLAMSLALETLGCADCENEFNVGT